MAKVPTKIAYKKVLLIVYNKEDEPILYAQRRHKHLNDVAFSLQSLMKETKKPFDSFLASIPHTVLVPSKNEDDFDNYLFVCHLKAGEGRETHTIRITGRGNNIPEQPVYEFLNSYKELTWWKGTTYYDRKPVLWTRKDLHEVVIGSFIEYTKFLSSRRLYEKEELEEPRNKYLHFLTQFEQLSLDFQKKIKKKIKDLT